MGVPRGLHFETKSTRGPRTETAGFLTKTGFCGHKIDARARGGPPDLTARVGGGGALHEGFVLRSQMGGGFGEGPPKEAWFWGTTTLISRVPHDRLCCRDLKWNDRLIDAFRRGIGERWSCSTGK